MRKSGFGWWFTGACVLAISLLVLMIVRVNSVTVNQTAGKKIQTVTCLRANLTAAYNRHAIRLTHNFHEIMLVDAAFPLRDCEIFVNEGKIVPLSEAEQSRAIDDIDHCRIDVKLVGIAQGCLAHLKEFNAHP